MANEYKSFYMKDLFSIIDQVAIDCMMCPIMVGQDKQSDNMKMVSRYNSDAAWNNEGVHEMATKLKAALIKESEDGA